MLDFGMAFLRKPGFRPLNRWLFDFGAQVDVNHWIKMKYNRQLHEASAEDLALYRWTLPERLAAGIKALYTDRFGQRPPALGGRPGSEADQEVRANSVSNPDGVWRRSSGERIGPSRPAK